MGPKHHQALEEFYPEGIPRVVTHLHPLSFFFISSLETFLKKRQTSNETRLNAQHESHGKVVQLSHIVLFAFLEDVVLGHAHRLHDHLHPLQVDEAVLRQVALHRPTASALHTTHQGAPAVPVLTLIPVPVSSS